MCGLSRSQQPDHHESVSPIFGRRIIGSAKLGLTFCSARSNQCLLSNEDQGRRWMEDGFQDPLWSFQVSSHAFQIDQLTGYVSGLHQQDPGRKTWRFRDNVSRWHPHLYWERGRRTRPSHSIGAGPTAEALIVCQPQEVPFSSGWGEIPRLHCLSSGHPNGRRTNKSRTWLAWALVSTWYTGLFRIHQFLLTIYSGIQ